MIHLWTLEEVEVLLSDAGIHDPKYNSANAERLAVTANRLAFLIGIDRANEHTTKALRAVIGYARRIGRGDRILHQVARGWRQAAEYADRDYATDGITTSQAEADHAPHDAVTGTKGGEHGGA